MPIWTQRELIKICKIINKGKKKFNLCINKGKVKCIKSHLYKIDFQDYIKLGLFFKSLTCISRKML